MARGKSSKPAPMPGGMDHVMPTGGATAAEKHPPVDMPHPLQAEVPATSSTDDAHPPGPVAK